jgi:ATP-grasp in the biosynthetic pathway with Ter operon
MGICCNFRKFSLDCNFRLVSLQFGIDLAGDDWIASLTIVAAMASHNKTRSASSSEFGFYHALTVVVVAGTPYIASSVIDSLPRGLPYFLIGHRNIAFLGRSKKCRQYFMNDLSLEEDNKTDFVRTIEQLGSANSNIFLIPVDDPANRIVYSTFDRLGARTYPIPDSRSFEMLNDKWRFQKYCSNLGVRVPKAVRLNDKTEIDFDYLCETVGLPFVLKPTNKNDSQGVHVISSKEKLRKEILSNQKYGFSPLIVQSYIPGIDIDVSVFAIGGDIKNYTVQIREKDRLCFVKNDQLIKLTEAIVCDLCYTGVIHIDARLHNESGEIFLVEANPRFWASLDEATLCGLNFVRAGMYNCMGLESPDPITISNVSSLSTRGILAEIATGKQNCLQLSPQQRVRLIHVMRNSIRKSLHLPWLL